MFIKNTKDIIGYRLESENMTKEDDFQTPEDEEVLLFLNIFKKFFLYFSLK